MKLSPREQQILALLSTGKTYQEAADYLGITRDTIRTHVRKMYPKLNAHSLAEAVANYELARNQTNPKGGNKYSDEQREAEKGNVK